MRNQTSTQDSPLTSTRLTLTVVVQAPVGAIGRGVGLGLSQLHDPAVRVVRRPRGARVGHHAEPIEVLGRGEGGVYELPLFLPVRARQGRSLHLAPRATGEHLRRVG